LKKTLLKINSMNKKYRLFDMLVAMTLILSIFAPVTFAADSVVKKYDVNGKEVPVDGVPTGGNSDAVSTATESNGDSNTGSSDLDVWGIQQSNVDPTKIVDTTYLMQLAWGIVPLRNISLLGVAIAFMLALCSTVIGVFLLIALAGYYASHTNAKKSMDGLKHVQSKLVLVIGIFGMGLFFIVMVFFFLYVFSKIQLFVK
jgi:hypothetical protein